MPYSLKRLEPITAEQVKEGFGNANLEVFTGSAELRSRLLGMEWENSVLLLMSSGTLTGWKLQSWPGIS